MASTGIRNGTDLIMMIGTTAVAFCTSNDFEITMATRDTSNKDSAGWAEKKGGQMSWTATAEGQFAEDSSYGFSDLFALLIARTAITVKLTTAVSGDNAYSGSALITSLSQSNPLEDTSTFSVSLEGSGVLTEALIV